MTKSNPEAFKPMKLQGIEVEPGTPESCYDNILGPDDELNFNKRLQSITNAERAGAVEGDSIIIA